MNLPKLLMIGPNNVFVVLLVLFNFFAHVKILCYLRSIIHVTLQDFVSLISELGGRFG